MYNLKDFLDKLKRSILLLFLTFCLLVIAFKEGFIPFYTLPSLGINYNLMGLSNIISQKSVFGIVIPDVLIPYGTEISQNLLSYYLIAFLNIFYSNIENSTSFFYFCCFILSIFALIGLFFHITKNIYISIFLTIIFYMDPFIISQSGIPPVKISIMLLPISVLLDAYIINNKFVKYKKIIFFFALSYLLRLIYPATSWYIAVILASSSGLFFAIYYLLNERWNIDAAKKYVLLVYIPWFIALLTIKLLTPKGIEEYKSDLDVFRGSAPDLLTILLPSDKLLLSKIFSINNYLKSNGLTFSGDSTMWNNFFGITFIVIGIVVFLKFKKTNKFIIPLFIVFLVTFIFGLGPSLKILSVIEATDQITYNNYLLTNEDVLFDFPWAFIFSIFPFSMMRAVYRWLIIPKFILLIASSTFLKKLFDQKRMPLILIISILMIIEFFPGNLDLNKGMHNMSQIKKFNSDVIEPLRNYAFTNQDRVIFYPAENDFLAPYIVSKIGFKSYNGGGDKALLKAQSLMPQTIVKFMHEKDTEQAANLILEIKEKQLAEYILLPYFSLRWESYYWPVSKNKYSEMKDNALKLEALLQDKLTFHHYEYFTIIDLANRGSNSNRGQYFPENNLGGLTPYNWRLSA